MQTMYKALLSMVLMLLLGNTQLWAQSPQSFKYQAVVRDASNAPLAAQNVGIRMSILEGSTSGAAVYEETFQATTDELGLISLNIGEGSVQSGMFMTIDWGSNNYFLKIEVDEAGGTNYQTLGTSQLMSVPYSLYAERAGSIGPISLDDLSNTNVSTPITGDVLKWDGINWSPSDDEDGFSPWSSGQSWIYRNGSMNIGQTLLSSTPPTAYVSIKTDGSGPNAITSGNDSVKVTDLSFAITKGTNGQGNNAIGMGFGSSGLINNGVPNMGAAIIHQRTGPSSIGKLHFATKGTQGDATNIPIRMTLDNNGNLGIGSLNPAGRLTVSNGTMAFEIHPGLLDATPNNDWTTFEMGGTKNLRIRDNFSVKDSVAIGSSSFSSDARLFVNGNIRVANDADLFGLDQLVGFNDLRFYGDGAGGPDMTIDAVGRVGIGGIIPNVALSVFNNSVSSTGLVMVLRNSANSSRVQVWDDPATGMFSIGNFTVASGTKNFGLDHPLDPANKTLFHNAVESPDMVTYYHGTVTLNGNGEGSVSLPDYFQALNKDYHYQLTCIGGFAQVYIASEIANNEFQIAGGKPGMKVSWQVSATRNDPWAQDHPYEAEKEKLPQHKGKYWYPQGYGESVESQIGYGKSQE